jgi:hypothetical protein
MFKFFSYYYISEHPIAFAVRVGVSMALKNTITVLI